jgi:hypothetical protein
VCHTELYRANPALCNKDCCAHFNTLRGLHSSSTCLLTTALCFQVSGSSFWQQTHVGPHFGWLLINCEQPLNILKVFGSAMKSKQSILHPAGTPRFVWPLAHPVRDLRKFMYGIWRNPNLPANASFPLHLRSKAVSTTHCPSYDTVYCATHRSRYELYTGVHRPVEILFYHFLIILKLALPYILHSRISRVYVYHSPTCEFRLIQYWKDIMSGLNYRHFVAFLSAYP